MMLDRRILRTKFQEITSRLKSRGEDLSALANFGELDKRRRNIISKVEQLKAKRNETSKQISLLKRDKQDATASIKEMQEVGKEIKELDNELETVDQELDTILLSIPNVPHESVPVGDSEDDNVEVRQWGERPQFSFEPKTHWDIATHLNIIDFERAAKVTGSRFVFYRGLGARLERALINFMMDLHAEEHGYEEMI